MPRSSSPTKRRDDDPVRVYADHRVAYWTGGQPGVGERKFVRLGDRLSAQEYAVELRRSFADGTPRLSGGTLDDLASDLIRYLEDTNAPTGTVRQYASDWNCWIPASVGGKHVRDATTADWAAIFDNLAVNGTPSVIKNVTRTLNAVIRHGAERGWFGSLSPFRMSHEQRTAMVRKARQAAGRRLDLEVQAAGGGIRLDMCPELDDVQELADAFEEVYPGYGARMVLLSFGSGLRFMEVLALRADSINLDRGAVAVDWQLDRYRHFPALARPKHNSRREALLWTSVDDVARSLIEDAENREHDAGWLFPRHRSTVGWAEQASKLFGEARDSIGWAWPSHNWLRHAYASWSLAPQSVGGHHFDQTDVQHSLGHKRLSTTLNTYVQPTVNGWDVARSRSATWPGLPS